MAMIFSARAWMVHDSVVPMLTTWPMAWSHSISFGRALTTSATWQKQRVCWPVPYTSSGSPVSAARTKRGTTIP